MADSPALATRGLTKSYDARRVVSAVDLTVQRGEVHGLLGPNGAGKTTLMRMVLGLVKKDAGAITFFDGEAAHDTVAGFVDAPRFHPYLSGRENLRLLARLDGATLRAQRGERDRIDAAIARVKLGRDADARVRGYSAGMRQRLALAAALLREPRLVLLDEPTSSLDPEAARDVRTCVRDLAKSGVAVLLSSHDMNEVDELCATLTVIDRGRVRFSGTVDALRARTRDATRTTHALATNDDDAAIALAAAHTEITLTRDEAHGDLEIAAEQQALDRFVVALGAASIAVRSLARRDASLESLVVSLTSEDDAASTESDAPSSPETASAADTRAGTLHGAVIVARVELAKLRAQAHVWAILGACVVAPFVLAAALKLQSSLPSDTLFGRHAKASGFAVPLVVLGFAAAWVLPLLASVVSGDAFSSEDRHGTWPMVLTRSRTRGEIFAGKTLASLAFAIAAVVALAIASVAAGAILVGTQPLVSLSGTELTAARASTCVALAWVATLPPVIAVSGLGVLVSAASRSSAAGIGAPVIALFVMQLLSFVDCPEALRVASLSAPFNAWHGLLADPAFHRPLWEGIAVSAIYFVASVVVARALFMRRDIGG
jgi:ABC-type multidrug transport system ATPase subunit/ABC-type transport system involved in multi-copper enzyme maturation permease subunit